MDENIGNEQEYLQELGSSKSTEVSSRRRGTPPIAAAVALPVCEEEEEENGWLSRAGAGSCVEVTLDVWRHGPRRHTSRCNATIRGATITLV